jgi:hypothetical protein
MLRRIALVVVSLLILVLAYRIATRWGSPRPVAELQGELVGAPVGGGGGVLWLERRTDGDHLLSAGGLGSPRELLAGRALGGLAVAGDRIYTTQEGASGGAQLVALGRGGGSTNLGTLSAPARQLVATQEWVIGLRGSESALPAAPFVVAAAPAAVVWAMPATGGTATPVAELVSVTDGAEVIGVAAGQVYWLVRSLTSSGVVTTVYRRAVTEGTQEVVVSVPGAQSVVLFRDHLVWTAPSRELPIAEAGRSVRTRPLEGGEERAIADWLGRPAALFGPPEALYVMAHGEVWSLGDARGSQRQLYLSTLGQADPAASGGVQYFVDRGKDKSALVARGLSWGAKLRLCLGSR